ncbi:MAG: hypothetical protein KDK60_03460, partial [Chlamydiia bacterium]|nr:hypothetical protein [Chlamydiia bacterium]
AIRYLSLANESLKEELLFKNQGFKGFDIHMLTKADGADELKNANITNFNGNIFDMLKAFTGEKDTFVQMRETVIAWQEALKNVSEVANYEEKTQLIALATDTVANNITGKAKLNETEKNYLKDQVNSFSVPNLKLMDSFVNFVAEKFNPSDESFDLGKFKEQIKEASKRFANLVNTNGQNKTKPNMVKKILWETLNKNETFKQKFYNHAESLIASINKLRNLKQVTNKVEETILSAIGRITDSEKGEEDFYFQMAMVPLSKELALAIVKGDQDNNIAFKEYVKKKYPNAIVSIQIAAKSKGNTLSEEDALEQLYQQAKAHLNNNENGIFKSYETALTYLMNEKKPSSFVAEEYEKCLENAEKIENKLENFKDLLVVKDRDELPEISQPSENYNSRYNLGKEALTGMFGKILGNEGEYGSPTLALSFIEFLGGFSNAAEYLEVDEELLKELVVDPKNGAIVPVEEKFLLLNRWNEKKGFGENGDLTAREALRIKLREKASKNLEENSELVISSFKDLNSSFENNNGFTIFLDEDIKDSKKEVQVIEKDQKMETTSGGSFDLLNNDNDSDN